MHKFNCIALVDAETTKKISEIMNDLSERTKSTNALEFVPHFTFRNDFEIADENSQKMFESLESVLRKFSPFKIKIDNFGFYPWKIVYLNIEVTPELQEMHEIIMNTIQKYREPWVAKVLLESPHIKGKQMEYIKEYGYQFAFEYYSPHFTVCGNDMPGESFEKIKKEIENAVFQESAVVEKIVCMDRNDNNNIVFEYNLKN